LRIKRALISVFKKDGIDSFATLLEDLGVEILSSGGTAKFLQDNGIQVHQISGITGFPEILDGRVKTIHPKKRKKACFLDSGSGFPRQRTALSSAYGRSFR